VLNLGEQRHLPAEQQLYSLQSELWSSMGREVDVDHMGNKNFMVKWEKERKEQRGKWQVLAALVGFVLISSATDFNCICIRPVLNQ
jgi:hypothetical protein